MLAPLTKHPMARNHCTCLYHQESTVEIGLLYDNITEITFFVTLHRLLF